MSKLFSVLLFGLIAIGCSDSIEKQNAEMQAQISRLSSEKANLDGLKQEIALLREISTQQVVQINELSENLRRIEQQTKTQKEDYEKNLAEYQSQIQKLNIPEKGAISGVVTYYFNENFGYKPDVGAEVLIFPVNAYKDFDEKAVDKNHKILSAMNQLDHPSFRKDARKLLATYNIDEDPLKGFEQVLDFDTTVKNMIAHASAGERSFHLTADGNGSFKKILQSGDYYVLVKSSHRRNVLQGAKIILKQVSVRSGEDTNVDAQFGIF